MEGQKLQDTERTNEVGYGWMNLGSLLLGLTAWGIPAVYFSRRKPGGDRAGLACLLSMAACAGALFLQVLYNKHLVELQDWSALMDTSGAVAWVSVLLLAVTLILDLFCLWAEGKLNEEERGKGRPGGAGDTKGGVRRRSGRPSRAAAPMNREKKTASSPVGLLRTAAARFPGGGCSCPGLPALLGRGRRGKIGYNFSHPPSYT